MAEDRAQRTEPATPKRREEARGRGEVAQSKDLQSVAVLGASLLALSSPLGIGLASRVAAQAQATWSTAHLAPDTLADFHVALLRAVGAALLAVLPLFAALSVAGAGVQLLQTGPLFSLKALRPRASRIDPIKGLKRIFSGDRLFDLAKSLVKVAVVGGAGMLVVLPEREMIVGLADVGPGAALGSIGVLARRLAAVALGILAVAAIADLLYQRWRYDENLRMSKREVRDELRQREGDPLLRGRFRERHRELSRTRMIAAVSEADVVVANPTHFAVALRYDRALAAPEVVAKGRNRVALRILETARAHRVPVVEDPPLARLLHRTCDVGRKIPENLYQAVAEVLAFVYRLDARRGSAWGARP